MYTFNITLSGVKYFHIIIDVVLLVTVHNYRNASNPSSSQKSFSFRDKLFY